MQLMTVSIRIADHRDWRVWRAIRLQALSEAPMAFGSTLADWQGSGDTEQRWRERLSIVGAIDLIALEGNASVGMLSAVPDLDNPQRVWLMSMWVTPALRGHGIAAGLIDDIVAWASSTDRTSVNLMVRDENHHAIALYERCGFVRTGLRETERDSAGIDWNQLEMTRLTAA
jgi:ribosomal protein S18 acetylase RimI-like enzyme